MRPISLLTAIIFPLSLAAPVPDKESNTPQTIPLPPPAAILALINAGLADAANPTDVAYATGLIAAAEAAAEAAAAAQKASGSISGTASGTTSKRQNLGSLLGILQGLGLGSLGSLGGLKERDENSKRQVTGLPDLGDLGELSAILGELGPVVSVAGDIPPVGDGGVLKRQDLPLVGSLPGVAGLTNDLPLGSLGSVTGGLTQSLTDPTSLLGPLKERAKRQEAAAVLKV
ncbi:2fa5710d-ae68-42e8-8fb1-cf92ac93e398 [Sclerotinia trifoliorum]|uniref:2fa5710d-ae68-42e8-8fb1-cf92ac93e398 n=1 Tax=Sclerotinia trifoliorum TaxID=28548 RepID=A0A8H2W591_9HELO|nr:2fa5710d-ae68-42e8-8fb1-cf92ac93e398 [Sclerotinia trifoliorum]